MTAERIGPNFAREWFSKIWSNPFCLVPVGSHSREDWSKFCPRVSWTNLVRSSLSSFPWLPVGNNSREDWTKFCPRDVWQKLVQSSFSLPSFPWLPVGSDRREDWTKFCRRAVPWTSSNSYVHHLCLLFFITIVISLSCLFALQNVVQSYRWEVTAARIGPNFAREWSGKIFGPILSAVISLVTGRK